MIFEAKSIYKMILAWWLAGFLAYVNLFTSGFVFGFADQAGPRASAIEILFLALFALLQWGTLAISYYVTVKSVYADFADHPLLVIVANGATALYLGMVSLILGPCAFAPRSWPRERSTIPYLGIMIGHALLCGICIRVRPARRAISRLGVFLQVLLGFVTAASPFIVLAIFVDMWNRRS